MKILLLVGTGGFIGSVCRYLLAQFVQQKMSSTFPYGTLTVNIIGCFVIGLVFAFSFKGNISAHWSLFLATGICGGFTTFSAFSNETIALFHDGQNAFALTYVMASLVLGLLATYLAITLVRMF